MRAKRASLIFSFLLLVISVSIISLNPISSPDSDYESISHGYEKSFTPHSPIIITNESDFTDLGFLGKMNLKRK